MQDSDRRKKKCIHCKEGTMLMYEHDCPVWTAGCNQKHWVWVCSTCNKGESVEFFRLNKMHTRRENT